MAAALPGMTLQPLYIYDPATDMRGNSSLFHPRDPRSDHIGWSTKTKLKRRVSLDEHSASLTRYEINIIKEVVAKADEVERKEEKRVR